jgi:hypothetical protein
MSLAKNAELVFGGCVINWSWYLHCTLNDDNTVTISRHYRKHNSRDFDHPEVLGGYSIEETEDRTAEYVHIQGERYKVKNPMHVFSYKE